MTGEPSVEKAARSFTHDTLNTLLLHVASQRGTNSELSSPWC
jgi:hypothetical protein